MKRICPYCGKIVDGDHDCSGKPKDTRLKNIHDSRWRRTANEVKQRDMCCKMCWDNGKLTTHSLEAHHIKWREVDDSEDNLFDINGIITLCAECHHEVHRHKMGDFYDYLMSLIND